MSPPEIPLSAAGLPAEQRAGFKGALSSAPGKNVTPKSNCTGSFELSHHAPGLHSTYVQAARVGRFHEEQMSLYSWGQQNLGGQGMQGTHTHLPVLGHHPHLTHKVYWRGVSGCCPDMGLPRGGLLRDGASPSSSGPSLHGAPSQVSPQPGCCLPVGAELRRMARVIPHLLACLEKQPRAVRAHCCRLLLGVPSLVVPVPLPNPPFLLPILQWEPSSCVAVPAPPRPSGSPSVQYSPCGCKDKCAPRPLGLSPSQHSSLWEA